MTASTARTVSSLLRLQLLQLTLCISSKVNWAHVSRLRMRTISVGFYKNNAEQLSDTD